MSYGKYGNNLYLPGHVRLIKGESDSSSWQIDVEDSVKIILCIPESSFLLMEDMFLVLKYS